MSRAGRKAFDRCANKSIEIKIFEETDDYHRGSGAILHCPRTDDPNITIASEQSNHFTKNAAIESMRDIASKVVCATCIFSNMSELEVSQYRLAVVKTDNARLEEQKIRTLALAELREIDPAYREIQ